MPGRPSPRPGRARLLRRWASPHQLGSQWGGGRRFPPPWPCKGAGSAASSVPALAALDPKVAEGQRHPVPAPQHNTPAKPCGGCRPAPPAQGPVAPPQSSTASSRPPAAHAVSRATSRILKGGRAAVRFPQCPAQPAPSLRAPPQPHLLSVEIRELVVPALREDDGEDCVGAAAGLVHVGGGHSPGKREGEGGPPPGLRESQPPSPTLRAPLLDTGLLATPRSTLPSSPRLLPCSGFSRSLWQTPGSGGRGRGLQLLHPPCILTPNSASSTWPHPSYLLLTQPRQSHGGCRQEPVRGGGLFPPTRGTAGSRRG